MRGAKLTNGRVLRWKDITSRWRLTCVALADMLQRKIFLKGCRGNRSGWRWSGNRGWGISPCFSIYAFLHIYWHLYECEGENGLENLSIYLSIYLSMCVGACVGGACVHVYIHTWLNVSSEGFICLNIWSLLSWDWHEVWMYIYIYIYSTI